MSQHDFDYFLKRLIYLGGNLGIQKPIKEYVDIEEFIVDASLYMDIDTRTREVFYNWLYLFSPYISPSKLRRVLRNKDYNKKYLGKFVFILKSHILNSQNWTIISDWTIDCRNFNFTNNPNKYLKDPAYIIKNCPELKFRVEGNNQVLADLKAYLKKHKNFKSLYQIAKNTFNPKNRINYEYRLMSYVV